MTRKALRLAFAAMSLAAAVLAFGCPAAVEARPGSGGRSLSLGNQSADAARSATKSKSGAKKTTVKRKSPGGKPEAAKNSHAMRLG